jgi:Zn-dependent protease
MQIHVVHILIEIVVIILSVGFHEFGHAAMAVKLGDPTPRLQGRYTLNPVAHLDPLGTLFIIVTVIGGFGLGWGKPVRTNPLYYQNYRRGLILVALAGPLMNVCLMMFGLGTAFLIFQSGAQPPAFVMDFLSSWVVLNLILATFNLIPIPPLDGGNVLASLLPGETGERYRRIGVYGMLVILFLMAFGVLDAVLFFFLQLDGMLIRTAFGADFARWLLGGLAG